MDIVFSGEISSGSKDLKTVLAEILSLKIAGTTILRLTNTQDGYNGRIFFSDGQVIRQVVNIVSDESPYSILRKLLTVQQGNFAYLQVGMFDDVTLIPNLNVDLAQVVSIMPNLPPDLRMLNDESEIFEEVLANPEQPFQNIETAVKSEIESSKIQQSVIANEDDLDAEYNPFDNLGQNPEIDHAAKKQNLANPKLRKVETDPNKLYIKRNLKIILSTVAIASVLSIVTYYYWENIQNFYTTANNYIGHNLSIITNGAISDPLNKPSDETPTVSSVSKKITVINKNASINKKPLKLKRTYHKHVKNQNSSNHHGK